MSTLLLLTAVLLPSADPDESAIFVLATGGQVEGQLLNPDQQPRETYLVATSEGGRIALRKSQVARVLTKSEDLRWYEAARPQTPPTVAGHWAMAEACRDRGLKAQREFHLQAILRLDPEHKEARYGLGYSNVDGRWVKTDEWMQSQGYVRYRGAWRIPQDVAIEQQAEQRELAQKQWLRNVKSWRTWIVKRRGKEGEAMAALRAIDDPAAAPALVDILEDTEEQTDLRILSIEVLGRLQSSAAVAAFIKFAIEDPNANIRDICLRQLSTTGTAAAVNTFQKLLASPDNRKVNRAAAGLAAIGQPRATLPLIESLLTEHKFVVQSGGSPGQLNLGFGGGPGGGGNSFGVGGKPKIVKQTLRNESVLAALVSLNPGINFGYDQQAWKNWFIDQHRPPQVNLRRDY